MLGAGARHDNFFAAAAIDKTLYCVFMALCSDSSEATLTRLTDSYCFSLLFYFSEYTVLRNIKSETTCWISKSNFSTCAAVKKNPYLLLCVESREVSFWLAAPLLSISDEKTVATAVTAQPDKSALLSLLNLFKTGNHTMHVRSLANFFFFFHWFLFFDEKTRQLHLLPRVQGYKIHA